MSERVESITHHGQEVIVVDLAKCSAEEVTSVVRRLPDVVSTHPPRSVLILGDFTGATFDEEAIRVMQQSAVFDKPYIKKAAWVGLDSFSYQQRIETFSRREFTVFKTRTEALDWLTEN